MNTSMPENIQVKTEFNYDEDASSRCKLTMDPLLKATIKHEEIDIEDDYIPTSSSTSDFHSKLIQKYHQSLEIIPLHTPYNSPGLHGAIIKPSVPLNSTNEESLRPNITIEIREIIKKPKARKELHLQSPQKLKNNLNLLETSPSISRLENSNFKAIQNSNISKTEIIFNNKSRYVCDMCSYTSKHLTDMRIHKRMHTGDDLFSCDECNYTCRQFSNLKSHKRKHTGVKQFACDQCDYTSNFLNNLQTHKVVHSGEKPFACMQCDYICGRPSNLKRHMLRHSEDKPFHCDTCPYSCKDLTGLKVHKLVHTGQKPFVCDLCNNSYVTLKSLNHHKKKHNLNGVKI